MSRSGRACDVLAQWKEHPKGCTADHGFYDGYDGPCTDDEWEIVQLLDMIDPMFRQDENLRLRALVQMLGGAEILAKLDGPAPESMDARHAMDAMAAKVREVGVDAAREHFREAVAAWKAGEDMTAG